MDESFLGASMRKDQYSSITLIFKQKLRGVNFEYTHTPARFTSDFNSNKKHKNDKNVT